MEIWRRLYKCPRILDPAGPPLGLGKLSARDSWRLQRSMERYRLRPDAVSDKIVEDLIMKGEIGYVYGMTITSTPYRFDI